jgi:hypothetical protein
VTFDSNVWQQAANPGRFPRDRSLGCFEKINETIRAGELLPCLAETAFTLEGVKRSDRRSFLASYVPETSFEVKELLGGLICIDFSIAPNLSHHPGNNPQLASHLQDALALGFRLLHCPRIGAPRNPDISDDLFLPDTRVPVGQRQDTYARCIRRIEARNCGIAHLKKIGEKYARSGQSWQEGMQNVPPSEDDKIAEAFAEWADGEAIAAHIACGNDYFCTRDVGNSGGTQSSLFPRNRRWLQSQYQIKFVTPRGLAKRLKERFPQAQAG